LRKVEPTGGGDPPGRNSSRVGTIAWKRSALAAVWSWKVWSTSKPSSAARIAGRSSSASGRVPKRPAARCQVRSVPGTPTPRPLVTRSAKGIGWPVAGSMKLSSRKAAGAVSRPSMVTARPWRASQITMNPPPPMPAEYGSVTPRVAAAATAASTALPPRRSTPMAALEASRSTVATAPPVPVATGRLTARAAVAAAVGAARAAVRLRMSVTAASRARVRRFTAGSSPCGSAAAQGV